MNQLDLTDVLASSFPWLNAYGNDLQMQQNHANDNGDMSYLSSRSVMLEPIMEETSDDDDCSGADTGLNTWSQYENAWSSESDTGSVIRVEINQGLIRFSNFSIFVFLSYILF